MNVTTYHTNLPMQEWGVYGCFDSIAILALPDFAVMEDSIPLPDDLPDDTGPMPRQARMQTIIHDDMPPLPDQLDDASTDNDIVELPDAILSRCCQKGCLDKTAVQRAKHQWHAQHPTSEAIRGELFRQVKLSLASSSSGSSGRSYTYFNIPVCRPGFQSLWSIGNSKLDSLAAHASAGNTEPPHDLRSARPVREQRTASDVADKFWVWMYRNVAESLAEGKVNLHDEMDPLLGDDVPPAGADTMCQYNADDGSTGLSSSKLALEPDMYPRHLPPSSWEDLLLLFDNWMVTENLPGSKPCSHSTVKRVYNDSWRQSLPFRSDSQHKKCDVCTEFKQWRRKVSADSPEVQMINDAYIKHIHDQMHDRKVDARIACMACQNNLASSPPSDPSSDILNFTIDAMEQAKFRVPRHDGLKSKTAAAHWRPQLHVTGSVVDGVKEFWYLSDCTLPKNANTQITMIACILQGAHETMYNRGRNFPAMIRCVSDNASSETKNQTVCKFMAWLVFKKKVRSAEMSQFRVGHTHNRQDQRFAICSTAIAKPATQLQDPLETIADFADVIKKQVACLMGFEKIQGEYIYIYIVDMWWI